MKPGQRFNRLVAVQFVDRPRRLIKGRPRGHRELWRFACDCGNETVVDISKVKCGHTKSCGCFNREVSRASMRLNRCPPPVIHGECGTPEYRTWQAMITRCTNANQSNFKHYGGRGIAICDRWRNSFSAFLADMGRKPSSQHSIDRINNDGSYEPGNCRWATKSEQSRNRRPRVAHGYVTEATP
jgi:hypothetical protein